MKVLFVVEHFYPYIGGAEELFLNLTTSLVHQGYEITVITTLYDNNLPKQEEFNGVQIIRVKCHNRFLFTFLSLPSVFKHAKDASFIHTTSYNSALPSFIAGLFLRKKVVITFHEVWGKLWFQLPFTSKIELLLFYLYEAFILKLRFFRYIAVSDFTKTSLIENGINAKRIVRIYNGLDYNNFQRYNYTPPKNFEFCFYGRLGISKGLNFLLEAFAQLIVKYPDARLKLIIPTYPEHLYKLILSDIDRLGLLNKIGLYSNLSKESLYHQVSCSSCVVIPSYSEGFCYVAAESMALGVPVISSGKGALKEVVNGKFITIEKLDAIHLMKAMELAINNKWEETNERKYELSDSISTYLNFYEKLDK